MKIWQIEDKIAYPALLILFSLLIYSRWGQWGSWLWKIGGMLLSLVFACGLVCMLIFSLLYFSERKKRERLEQEVRELKFQLGKEE